MLFAVTLGFNQVLLFILAAVAAASVVAFLNKKDTGIEQRRRSAIDLAGHLDSLGLDVLSGVVKSYAVGDYGAVIADVKHLHDEVKTPDVLMDRLRKSFRKQLVARLEQPEEVQAIVDAVRPYLQKLDAQKQAPRVSE